MHRFPPKSTYFDKYSPIKVHVHVNTCTVKEIFNYFTNIKNHLFPPIRLFPPILPKSTYFDKYSPSKVHVHVRIYTCKVKEIFNYFAFKKSTLYFHRFRQNPPLLINIRLLKCMCTYTSCTVKEIFNYFTNFKNPPISTDFAKIHLVW